MGLYAFHLLTGSLWRLHCALKDSGLEFLSGHLHCQTSVPEGRDQTCTFLSPLGPRPVAGTERVFQRYWCLLYSRPSRQLDDSAREGGKLASHYVCLDLDYPNSYWTISHETLCFNKRNSWSSLYVLGCSKPEAKGSRGLEKMK